MPDVNVAQVSGDATAADNLELACDGTGYNLGGGSVVAASVATGGLTAASFADGRSVCNGPHVVQRITVERFMGGGTVDPIVTVETGRIPATWLPLVTAWRKGRKRKVTGSAASGPS